MTYKWNDDYNRFAIARNILLQIVDSIYDVNNEVEFAVRLYGADYPAQDKNCFDSRLLVPFNLQNVNQIKQSLKYTDPIGWSPIAYSLEKAAFGEINNTNSYDYSIIFITDGGESCGGDICKTYVELLKKKVSVNPYIIGLDNNKVLKSYYDCLGKYVAVIEVGDIPKAVKLIVDENRPILNKEIALNLKTVFSNSPVIQPKEEPKKVIVENVQKQEPKKVDTVAKVKEIIPEPPKRVNHVFQRLEPLSVLRGVLTRKLHIPEYVIPIFNKVEYKIDFEIVPPRVKYVFQRLVPFSARRNVISGKEQTPNYVVPIFSKVEYKIDFEIEPPRVNYVLERMQPFNAQRADVTNKRQIPDYVVPIFSKVEYKIDFEIEPPRMMYVLAALRRFEPRWRFVYAYRTPSIVPAPLLMDKIAYIFTFEPIKRDTIIQVLTKPQAPVVAQGVKEQENTNVSREVVPSDNTMVQIFFVNKFQRKRMYTNAAPTIILKDAITNQEVGQFIRSTERGVPDLQPIKPGTYNFVVKGDNRIVTPNVKIDANNINKVFIEVTDGTIEFAYIGNLGRPVNEFQAIVNPRFEDKGKTVIQECKDKLYYSPATYYIEVNTLPATKFAMVELDFGEIRQIQIAEPGFLQINNTERLGNVDFFAPDNDSYSRFHSINVTGNIANQKIRLQPSRQYKAVFLRDPKVPALGTKEITFIVESNKVTQLILE